MSDVEPTLPEPTHILVLANETVAGRSLVEALRGHAARGPIRVTVLCPQNDPLSGYVVYEESRRSAAERRLQRDLELMPRDFFLQLLADGPAAPLGGAAMDDAG